MTKRNTALVTLGLILSSMLASLDSTITNTALPTIIGELNGLEQMAWIASAYLLAAAVVVPVVGKLADSYGRRRWYLLGLFLFMLGSALCGAAQSMSQLILFRGLQGLGAGVLTPLAQTIVGDLYPGEKRAKMQGLFASLFGLVAIIGPKVGGWIVDAWHWRWAFYINLPLGFLAMALIWFALKETVGGKPRSIDYAGAATVAFGTAALMLALDLGNQHYAWTSWQVVSLFAAAAMLLTGFVVIERRAEDPILPLKLYRNRILAVTTSLSFLVGAGMLGTLVFIPLFMQGVTGASAGGAGSALTPMMLALVAGSILGSRLLLKLPYRSLLTAGMAIVTGGFFLMTTLTVDATETFVKLCMVVIGLGLGLVMPTLTIAVQNAFPAEQRGVVTASLNFARAIGSSVGVTVFSVIMNARASTLMQNRLAALSATLPPQAAPALAPLQTLAAENPGNLLALLLRPDLLERYPAALRESITLLLKQSLTDSLHTTFLVALACAALAITIALLTGPARMPRKTEAATPTVAVAD